MSERIRGIIVQPVTVGPETDWHWGPMMQHAVAVDPMGQHYIICAEGVGHPITPEEFAQCTPDGNPVDLADFIRTFGSRLDTNHYMWVRKLAGTYVITGKDRRGRQLPPVITQHPEAFRGEIVGTLWWRTPDGRRTRLSNYPANR